jgi:RNA-directed DNA polymerase
LKLADEKTHITHMTKGFNFLGFHFRRYKRNRNRKNDSVLLIRPQQEKILSCKRKIKTLLKKNKTFKQSSVIYQLNPIIRGWGNYYRHVVSSQVFGAIGL